MGFSDEKYLFFGANEGNLDYYFINGKDIKEVVKNYTILTGRSPLPQMWTLGYHQSRWSYFTSKEAREIVNKYRELNIPLDAIHLDIDYMERYKVFTINKETYSDFDEMVKDFNDLGVKVVTIIDPGVKIEKGYNIYEEGIKNNYFAFDENGVYKNAVWPGDSVFPSFVNSKVREWWGDNCKFLVDHGVRGIWTDMNEPASFKGPLPDNVEFKNDKGKVQYHDEIHNVYGHLMSKATYEGLKEKVVEPEPEKPLPFEDVSEKQWYHSWIKEAYQLGLMTGATETLFKPNSNMNRGMVAIVFHRMEGSKKVEYSKVFPDVANNQYYTTSVLWAKANGVINGYTDGTFKPLKNVTREEMVTMIYNFAKYKGLDVKSEHNIKYFNDYAKITQYAKAPLRWAVENELISGKDNGTRLDPLGTATRAECCKMLVQAYKVIYK